MIQRIQTFFLIDVFLIGLLLIIFPFEIMSNDKESWSISLNPLNRTNTLSTIIWLPTLLNALVLLLSVICIVNFKNRKRQMKLAMLLLFLFSALTSSLFLIDYLNLQDVQKTYTWAAFLPLAGMVFSFLALRFIKKDEELVKSADRLR